MKILTAGTAALLLALPTAAEAATVVSAPCVNSTAGVPVSGFGFAPGAPVTVGFDGALPVTVSADAQGAFGARVVAPAEDERRPTTLTATDGATSAVAPAEVVFADADVSPRVGYRSRRVRIRGIGLTAGAPVWLHYRRGGRTIARTRLSRKAGACGAFSARGRYMRFRGQRDGAYELRLTSAKRYSASARPQASLEVSFGAKVDSAFRARPSFLYESQRWFQPRP